MQLSNGTEVTVRRYRTEDAEEIVNLIIRNFKEVNVKDYGEEAVNSYQFQKKEKASGKQSGRKILKVKKAKGNARLHTKYRRGDSVMVYPEQKIGIVCEPINEKGVLRIQLPGKKIWINHKRVKLHVAAEELYPEDYDFSIIFDTVENRKIRHDMERKYTEEIIRCEEGI